MSDARRFATDAAGVTLVVEISDEMQRAMGVLLADGMPEEQAALTVIAGMKAATYDGRGPVEFAHHLVKLRRTFREATTISERTQPCAGE